MTDPSVVVQGAPDGWTHIGGPGMHLLIGLEEDDDRTLTASDAADGGQLDDVIDVLTMGGPRKAHHFVGVHWRPRTRVVAFGPVSAMVTMADGTEHEVRALNPRVWTDLVLDTHPERVELRILEDTEAREPTPASTLVGGPGGVAVVSAEVRPPEPPTPSSVQDAPEPPEPATQPEPSSQSSQEDVPPPTRALPTFGAGPAESAEAPPSPWDRSWSTPTERESAPALPSWGPGPAVLPRRVTPQPAAAAESRPPKQDAAPALPALPVVHSGPADVESTWSVKPTPTEDERRTSQSDEAAAPSYDYLFGRTVTVDEHRQLLADVESEGEGEPDLPEVPAPSPPPPPSPSPSTTPAPVPSATPTTSATGTPASPTPPTGGGLISSVPWASGAASAHPDHGATPESRPDVPSFSGRHTPPPSPSLLPPVAQPVAQPVVPPVAPVVEDPHAHLHEDADELTVDRSALIDARLSAQSGASGPSVLAVLCSPGTRRRRTATPAASAAAGSRRRTPSPCPGLRSVCCGSPPATSSPSTAACSSAGRPRSVRACSARRPSARRQGAEPRAGRVPQPRRGRARGLARAHPRPRHDERHDRRPARAGSRCGCAPTTSRCSSRAPSCPWPTRSSFVFEATS